MEKLSGYRQIIKEILGQHAEIINRQPTPGLDKNVVFDEERDHYMLYKVGWTPQGRVDKPTVYVRIHQGKFWIEVDWTGHGIANDLLEAGVPKEDIVLAFHPPEMRPHTEFAVT